MAGVVLSRSPEVPVEDNGSGSVDGAWVGASGREGWSLYMLVWLGAVDDGNFFSADLGEACTCIVDGGAGEGMWARRWTLQCGASEVRS